MAALAVQMVDGGWRWMTRLPGALVAAWRKVAARFTDAPVSATAAKAAERRRRKEIRRKHGI